MITNKPFTNTHSLEIVLPTVGTCILPVDPKIFRCRKVNSTLFAFAYYEHKT